MKYLILLLVIHTAGNILMAEESAPKIADSVTQSGQPEITAPVDKLQGQGVEVISANGSVTRAPCPYTCEMRGLPKEHCKTWPSPSDPGQCYVWDTRLPQHAIPLAK